MTQRNPCKKKVDTLHDSAAREGKKWTVGIPEFRNSGIPVNSNIVLMGLNGNSGILEF